MKKQLFIFGITIVMMACTKKAPVNYALLSGKIDNLSATELTIFNAYDGSNNRKIKVNANGSFTDTIKANRSIYTLKVGKNQVSVYLDNGSEINLTTDANDFNKSLNISGKGSEVTNYLIFKNKKTSEIEGNRKVYSTLKEDDFKNKAKGISRALSGVIDTLQGIPTYYKVSEKRNLYYSYLLDLTNYESNYNYYIKNSDFKASSDLLAELDGLDYNNEDDFLFSYAYKRLIDIHFNKKIQELAKKDSIDYSLASIKVHSKILNTTIKNRLLFNGARFGMDRAENLEDYYQQYMSASQDEANNVQITEIYNNLKTIVKGEISPKFNGYENNEGGTLSLDDLKGKYLYIDVWATWCGPCIGEIPDLKRVEKEYHGKNINFLSLSIDEAKDHDKWKKMIVDKELGGIQLLADKAWDSQFVKDYLIRGIPRFILIDPQGNIVTSNAPRPSQPELISLFNDINI